MALIPGPAVDKLFGISSRTRMRWVETGKLPKPHHVNGRQFFEADVRPKFDGEELSARQLMDRVQA